MKENQMKLLPLIVQEPFRIFFPLGFAISLLSVCLWPLYYDSSISYYPLDAHARTMTLGFVGALVIGFMGTAFPRLLQVKPMQLAEFLAVLVTWLSAMVSYFINLILIGDALSLLLMIGILTGAIARFPTRQDIPPPGLVLVAFAMISMLLALILNVLRAFDSLSLPFQAYAVARDCLYLGFPCLTLMGVAPYFFPKVLGTKNKHEFDESRSIPVGWLPHALFALTIGIISVLGLVLRGYGNATGGWIFAIAVLGYGVFEIPMRPSVSGKGSMSLGINLGICSVYIGLFLMVIFPQLRTGYFHLLIIAGVAMCIMIVSIRVIYGHSGNREGMNGRQPWILTLMVGVVFTALTRLSADLMPEIRISHLIYAASLWVFPIVIWFIVILKLLLKADED